MTQVPSSRAAFMRDDIESWRVNPAAHSNGALYLIEDKKIIGQVRIIAGRCNSDGLYTQVTIKPADDASRDYFNDDEIFQELGDPWLKFNGITGGRYVTGDEKDDARYPYLYVVNKTYFDMGICHPFFDDVEGFGGYHKEQNKLRIHTSHKARKARSSNKIKKVDKVRYFYVNIGMSPPEYREELFSKIEYTDVYTWYMTLGGEESDRGDHDIVVRTNNETEFRKLIDDLAEKYHYQAEIHPATIMSNSGLHAAVARINEKYPKEVQYA